MDTFPQYMNLKWLRILEGEISLMVAEVSLSHLKDMAYSGLKVKTPQVVSYAEAHSISGPFCQNDG